MQNFISMPSPKTAQILTKNTQNLPLYHLDLMKFQEMPPPPKTSHPTHTQPRATIKPNIEYTKKAEPFDQDNSNSGSLFDSNEISKEKDEFESQLE